MTLDWLSCERGEDVHVMPLNDLRDHTYTDCWCRPRTDIHHDSSVPVIVHFAADRREHTYERGWVN